MDLEVRLNESKVEQAYFNVCVCHIEQIYSLLLALDM